MCSVQRGVRGDSCDTRGCCPVLVPVSAVGRTNACTRGHGHVQEPRGERFPAVPWQLPRGAELLLFVVFSVFFFLMQLNSSFKYFYLLGAVLPSHLVSYPSTGGSVPVHPGRGLAVSEPVSWSPCVSCAGAKARAGQGRPRSRWDPGCGARRPVGRTAVETCSFPILLTARGDGRSARRV